MKNKLKTIGIILLTMFAMLILFIGIIGLGNVFQNNKQNLIGSIFMLLFPILTYLGVIVFNTKVNKLTPADYGFDVKKFGKNTIIGISIALTIWSISFVIAALFFDISVKFVPLKPNFTKSLLNTTIALLIVGGWEEFYFRGLVFITLIKNKFRFHVAAFISSILFSLAHWTSFDLDDTSYFWYIGIIFIGYILVYIYTITKSIWSVFSFHFVWNFIATLLNEKENEIGLLFTLNYKEHSKVLDNIVVFVLGCILITIILTVEKKNIKYKMLKIK